MVHHFIYEEGYTAMFQGERGQVPRLPCEILSRVDLEEPSGFLQILEENVSLSK